MKKKIISFIMIIICAVTFSEICFNTKSAKADNLSDTIEKELENIDLSALEEYFNNIENKPQNIDFFSYIKGLIKGDYSADFNSVLDYSVKIFLNAVYIVLPIFISIIAIALFGGLISNIKGDFISSGTKDLVSFVCLLSVILLLFSEIISLYKNAEIVINNIANLTEIMSPIILTLMVASGGTISASVYKPATTFLSSGIINVLSSFVMPIISLIMIFTVLSNLSTALKFDKFIDFFSSIIKWVIGLIITIFGMFLTVQGISSAIHDGISVKAAKFAISNSIPMIGGFVKDGFDLIVAGSVIIKNTIGFASVIALFYTILSPILLIAVFSLLLKLVSSIIEPVADGVITNFCYAMSRCISYLSVVLITVGLMLFVLILLMTMSANASLL